jgi:hypothetical protein
MVVFLKTSLTKGMEDDKAQEFKGLFIEAHLVRKRLIEILEEKRRGVQTERLGKEDYNLSWAYKQADLNGYERSINELISLLET